MHESFRALCSDFYINQKLSVKLELPRGRETVLELFERIRRGFGSMDRFKRYRDEIALESSGNSVIHRWLAIRGTSVRSGVVNPASSTDAYGLHRLALEVCPFYLSISPLDVDFVELLYGFDLECSRQHDGVIYDALIAGSPMAELLDMPGATPVDCQPMMGFSFGPEGAFEAHVEVKSRNAPAGAREGEALVGPEPISVYLTVRRLGPVEDIHELPGLLDELASHGEQLVEDRIGPKLLAPLREAIGFGSI